MTIPEELKYSTDHTWVRVEDDKATVGITDFAQSWLGELLSIDLFEERAEIEPQGLFGTLETSKVSFELYSPIGGTIIQRNDKLQEQITLINDDPYGGGWMIILRLRDVQHLTNLIDARAYQETIKKWEARESSHE